jgi:amino acid adenylation domain-containing protein
MSTEKGAEYKAAINPFSLQNERDHQSLVIEYNNSAAPYPADKTVVELFESQVVRTPEDEAIRLGGQRLTYRELNDRANQMAAKLRIFGIDEGQFVAIYMGHSIEVVCAMLGVLKAGAAYVPIDIATPKGRLAFILQDIVKGVNGTLPVLVTQSSLVSDLPIGAAKVVTLDADFAAIVEYPVQNPQFPVSPDNLAYVIYTSGSTGTPKGVMIEHRSLVNYIWWANEKYCKGERLTWPLYSSLAFDLTVTSIFTPLISGGRIVVYHEDLGVHGTGIFKVVEDNVADIVKLTPAHLAMIKDTIVSATKIRKFIVGGEDFKTELASHVTRKAGHPVEIYNEYGPTEATVGCMIHRYDREKDLALSVPIGMPAANICIFILDEHLSSVPVGEKGEIYIAGDGLARGYFNRPELTAEKFINATDPRQNGPVARSSNVKPVSLRLYKTGDIARWNANGSMEFLGRADNQVKVGGVRIELGEIEACLLKHADVRECVVNVVKSIAAKASEELYYCTRCGLASNVPGTSYDAEGVCNFCRSYDTYVDKAQAYFETAEELKTIVAEMKAARIGDYDCLVLFSGGKDSTYMLYQLCALGLKPLAFTLDHEFISEETKANICRTVQSLGLELVTGSTPHMNDIFVDSLKLFSNVCNGCFKTIYTLATNIAYEKGIRYIVTGLSRGQFFETRLNEEFFQIKDFDIAKLDALVLEARKAYHRREDAVSCYLNVDIFRDDTVFEEIQFVDFYRYWSVPLEELYAFLHKYASWGRPSDTGRSTNCLINDVGIYLHKKQRGFHNYSIPYSWDVRLGQKTREESMAELEDEIDESRVKQIMARIGYTEPSQTNETGINLLVAYYVSEKLLTVGELRAHLAQEYPAFMLPQYVIRLDKLPLTSNGKIDRKALPAPTPDNLSTSNDFVRPRTETEKALAAIWTDLLKVEIIGINKSFFELGGHSLLAIKAVSRIRDVFEVDLPIQTLFKYNTIADLAKVLAEAKGSIEIIQPLNAPLLESESADLAAREEIERTITTIWHEVLQLEEFGVNDDFFKLGGSLLSSSNLLAKINQAFKVELPLNVIFQERTVKKLADLIEKYKDNNPYCINSKRERLDLNNVIKLIG